jgi:hypothetical protein
MNYCLHNLILNKQTRTTEANNICKIGTMCVGDTNEGGRVNEGD